MRIVMLLLALALLDVTAAGAVVDPDPDGVGVYFDQGAETCELSIGPHVPFFAHVILTNPSSPDFHGFEFHYRLAVPAGMESLLLRLAWTLPPGVICLFCEWDPLEDDVVLDWTAPLPTADATVLFSWQYMILAPIQVDFHLAATPFMSPDHGMLAYLGSTGIVPMHVSSGDPARPVASVNGTAVPVTPLAFGAVKALYH